MRKAPKPREPGGQHKTLEGWDWKHDAVLKDMKQAILSDPILQRPDCNRRFYLKTDYSSRGMERRYASRTPPPRHEQQN